MDWTNTIVLAELMAVSLVFLIHPIFEWFYRRSMRKAGRVVNADQAQSALLDGCSIVRIGQGRAARIWVLDITGLSRHDIEFSLTFTTHHSGRLLVGCPAIRRQQLIDQAATLNRFVDIPYSADFDPM